MNRRAFLQLTTIVLFLAATSYAQNHSAEFTSAYTDLNKSCKTIAGTGGTDDASVCRGVGGYQIRVYSSAAALHINAEIKATSESFNLATVSIDFDESKTTVEWRMANGKPFAVILRVPKYGDPTDDNPYFGKVIGQELRIRGLKGYDIDLTMDARQPGANAKARSLADKAYADSGSTK
jgi:hypothetical protein